ncbi:MAG TPA: hypothetical protein DCY13_05225 [Verrucomicrobiales bacterium]|nr:hypothetical protein [Verrucomicrobiales bacterium]
MAAAIRETVDERLIPGGVLWIERNGVAHRAVHGNRAMVPELEAMTEDTIFDIASLTKVVATAPAVMKLVEQGRLGLNDAVQRHIPEFTGEGKEAITVRQLLTHNSGLRPGIGTRPAWSGYDTAIEMACAEKPIYQPDTDFRYSDINFFMLAEVVRRVSGQPFEEFVQTAFYRPLKMTDTGFKPSAELIPRIAPTEPAGGTLLRGVVHDPTARYMGGVAGHAGLFSTAADLARFARMMLNHGELDGVRVLEAETVRLMTSVQSPEGVRARRGLGWDIDSGYSRPRGHYFPLGSYGHTGFTGTCLWIDPFEKVFWLFLSNRLHPDGRGNVLPLQARLADLAALAIKDVDYSVMPGALTPRAPANPEKAAALKAEVLNGIDVLVKTEFAALRGLKVGLITNHTGRDRQGRATIDLLHQTPDVQLAALFSPEHGIRGELDEKVGDGKDEKTGLPIYSLYGERRTPAPEQLAGLDALVFDIQDIGCRFYTYISTMGNSMEAAGKAGIRFIVLDRVNLINGADVAGPVLVGKTDFVGWHTIPVRHGMTVGELARMFNAERQFKTQLTVIPLDGWSRELWMDECGFQWVNTSPNMRSLTQAALYPGVGLLEMTPLSVGRGTDTPFELFGAPYVDGVKVAAELNAFGIRGVRFDPIEFTPDASKFKGQKCGGVRISLADRTGCDVINIGIASAIVLHRNYGEQFELDRVNVLLKHAPTIEAIKAGKTIQEIRQSWEPALRQFMNRRQQYLLYAGN